MPAEIWERQIAAFQSMYRVIAMDPRAQSRSAPASEGLYPAARARAIKAVVDELGLAPVVLVGWSMAVNELAAYVDQFGTQTVAGLVLVDGSAGQDVDLVIMPRNAAAHQRRSAGRLPRRRPRVVRRRAGRVQSPARRLPESSLAISREERFGHWIMCDRVIDWSLVIVKTGYENPAALS